MKIFLLTHEREINRKTNTGSLAVEASNGMVERILWDRIHPNKKLLKLIESNSAMLLYPNSDAEQLSIENFDTIIIVDATWQEAQKMVNKSPYLKTASKATLQTQTVSKYQLRRNQPEGGLCTIECIIEVLKLKGNTDLAEKLALDFAAFNK